MKQLLIITRITGNDKKDEFRALYGNTESPVAGDFENFHLDIYSGLGFYDEDDEEVAKNIQSKIDIKADEVLIVIHSLEFDGVKSELIELQNGADWQIQQYSSEDNNYEKITKAFQDVVSDPSRIETIDKLFSADYFLEAKLELLHNCIFPESIPSEEDLDNSLSDFSDSFKSFKERVKEIKENIEKNKTKKLTWNNKDYIEALTKLRIALLGS